MELKYFSNAELLRVSHCSPTYDLTEDTVQALYDPELLCKLDRMRHFAGIPILLTSGFRCREYNSKVGGSPTSSHLSGLAMDISCSDTSHRYFYIAAAIKAGFPRIGIGRNYLHLDIDDSKPGPLLWLYK